MKELKVGVVGLGNMGSAHAKCIFDEKINGMQLSAVCDIDKETVSHYSQIFSGVKTYYDYRDMIENAGLDAVIVATPHYSHTVIARFAFENRLNVLVEKPAGVMASEVKKMNLAAINSGKVFSVMFNQRTDFLFNNLRKIVKNGELGDIKRVTYNITNWYRTEEYYKSGGWRATWDGEGGGVLVNQAPHNLDILQWIFGQPRKIFAVLNNGKYHDIEVEDDATVLMQYENGTEAVFITSTGETPGTNRLEVSGSRGKAVLENGLLKLWQSVVDERTFCKNALSNSAHIEYRYSETRSVENPNAHRKILQNFADSILLGTPLISNGSEALNEVMIANAAYLSAWTGKWIDLKNIDFEEYDNRLLELRKNSQTRKKEKTAFNNPSYKDRWQVRW